MAGLKDWMAPSSLWCSFVSSPLSLIIQDEDLHQKALGVVLVWGKRKKIDTNTGVCIEHSTTIILH